MHRVIRLRHALEAALRHPLLGPLLLLALAAMLAFVALHALEHGLAGALFTCAILAAAALRLAIAVCRWFRAAAGQALPAGRAPPRRESLIGTGPEPLSVVAFPLRR